MTCFQLPSPYDQKKKENQDKHLVQMQIVFDKYYTISNGTDNERHV